MRARCNKPNSTSYPRYGARGIRVCQEWDNSFAAFRTWAIENGYDESLTIERIKNDKNYQPDNCRFATAQEQSLNRRKRTSWRSGLLCTSKYKGVIHHKAKAKAKWQARITINKKQTSLGYFETEEGAARAYDARAKAEFGSVCTLNFPGE